MNKADSKQPDLYVRHLRIFLASPSDVHSEREDALKVIHDLQYEPAFRGKVFLEPVAWDTPGAGTVMRATMTPQEAIKQGLPHPAECNVVVVIFWERMGTPLPHPEYQKANGKQYFSGTEWEFENGFEHALLHNKPDVIVYRCMKTGDWDPKVPDFKSRLLQFERVEAFFAQFKDPATGAILRAWNEYQKPGDFREKFTGDIRQIVHSLLKEPPDIHRAAQPSPALPLWSESPFPGLRAFTNEDAPYLFRAGA